MQRRVRSNKRLVLFLLSALAVLSITCLPAQAAAQELQSLFQGALKPINTSSHGVIAQSGKLNKSLLVRGAEQIDIELPDGTSITAQLVDFERRGRGNFTWRGTTGDSPGAINVTLTLQKGFVAGSLFIGASVYEIRPVRGAGAEHLIEQLDMASFDEGADTDAVAIPADAVRNTPPVAADLAGSEIHLLSVYSPQAEAGAGGTAQIEAAIQSAIDLSNTAFINSNMDARFVLVHTTRVERDDSNDSNVDLDWVRSNATVSTLRDTYGADMVSLITESGGCGLGYVLQSISGSPGYAFQVTRRDCLGGNLTLTHEHGHNMGFAHNPENAGVAGIYSDSYGHWIDGVFRTVMSYSNPCTSGCSRVTHFSDPLILEQGYDTGITDARNNAASGRLTAPVVAAYRSAVVTGNSQTLQVSGGNDDVEERTSDGFMYMNSSDIELGNETPTGSAQTEGLRFNNLKIPQGATITGAYLTFTVDEVDTVSTTVNIRAQDADNAEAFSTTAYDLTSRSRTTQSVSWNIPSWSTVGVDETSPDLSAVVQEVVDRTGWSVGNSMIFVIDGSGSRTAESYEGSAAGAARLYVDYTNATPTGEPPVSTFTYNCVDLACTFTDTSVDSDGSIVSWQWNFGDGNQSTSQNPVHTYTAGGIYEVYLTATDNDGDNDFSSQLVYAGDPEITRGPYLQTLTDDSVIVRWRTNFPTESWVDYGTSVTGSMSYWRNQNLTTEHSIKVSGLNPLTQYYYRIGNYSRVLAGNNDPSYTFTTAPTPGTSVPTRFWVIGDSGTANANARAVRDRYKEFAATSSESDFMLMLGDNAYNSGTDAEYQAAVFDTYPELLRRLPLWSTLGNHDGYSADSGTQTGPYYDIFELPTAAEAGGLASGTEAYYSFDYGDIHFVVLDSYDTSRAVDGAMMTWLEADLIANDKPWVIAFWHHPPYTKGSHNSDTESQLIDMREIALPILEAAGVDLVLSGHSHTYERSRFIDGHYDVSTTLDKATMVLNDGDGAELGGGVYVKPAGNPAMNEGAVYAVAGSSGKLSTVKSDWPHPVMVSYLEELGSMVIDVDGDRFDAVFLNSSGVVNDRFSIVKTDCAARQPMAARQWTLFSLPCMPADARASRIFSTGPDEADYGSRWNLFSYNAETSKYERLDADTVMTAGKGYWYYSVDAHDWAQVAGSANPVGPVALVTNADPSIGTWNLVGNPHNATINWKDVTVYDGATPYSWLEMDPEAGGYDCEETPTVGPDCMLWHVMNRWENGSAYAAYDGQVGVGGTLGPFDAMWIRSHRSDSIEMDLPVAADIAAAASSAPRKAKKQAWDVNLIAESGNFRDHANWLGQADNASNGLDSRDLEEWAPFSNSSYLTILFTNKKFGKNDWGHTRDYRGLTGKPRGTWDFVVRASANISEVTLSWQGDIGLFSQAKLINQVSGETIDVHAGGTYSFEMDGNEHPFSIEFK